MTVGRVVVGGLGALDGSIEVVDELVGLVLLAEDLTEHGDLTLELLVEGLTLARLEVDDRGIGHEVRDRRVVLREPLTADDQVGLDGDDRFEVGLAVESDVDDRVVLHVRHGLRHERDGGGGEFDAPVGERLECAVIEGHDRRGRRRDLVRAGVVLDRDGCCRGFGLLRFRRAAGSAPGEGEEADESDARGGEGSGHGHGETPVLRDRCAHDGRRGDEQGSPSPVTFRLALLYERYEIRFLDRASRPGAALPQRHAECPRMAGTGLRARAADRCRPRRLRLPRLRRPHAPVLPRRPDRVRRRAASIPEPRVHPARVGRGLARRRVRRARRPGRRGPLGCDGTARFHDRRRRSRADRPSWPATPAPGCWSATRPPSPPSAASPRSSRQAPRHASWWRP